jgi:hypothetical protein
MVPFLLLLLLFVALPAVCIAGWSVDSRDPRFSLWPLTRLPPQEPRRLECATTLVPGRRRRLRIMRDARGSPKAARRRGRSRTGHFSSDE